MSESDVVVANTGSEASNASSKSPCWVCIICRACGMSQVVCAEQMSVGMDWED